MWQFWPHLFGEYILSSRHLDWLRDTPTFRFYPMTHAETVETYITQQPVFLLESRTFADLNPRAEFDGQNLRLILGANELRQMSSAGELDCESFLYGAVDCADDARYGGFVPLGFVMAERPDSFTARIPVNPDGLLFSVEWGPIAFRRLSDHYLRRYQQWQVKIDPKVLRFRPDASLRTKTDQFRSASERSVARCRRRTTPS